MLPVCRVFMRMEVLLMTKDKKNNTFPRGFFTKVRPEVTPSKNPDDKIIPIKWSDDVLKQKRIAKVTKINM